MNLYPIALTRDQIYGLFGFSRTQMPFLSFVFPFPDSVTVSFYGSLGLLGPLAQSRAEAMTACTCRLCSLGMALFLVHPIPSVDQAFRMNSSEAGSWVGLLSPMSSKQERYCSFLKFHFSL